jgi:hypothetical protein
MIGKIAVAAGIAAALFGAEAASAAPQVSAIKITHANYGTDTNLDWLQVAEVHVFDGATDITSLANLTASSYYGGNPLYAPAQAVDGNPSTFFHAGSNGPGEFLELDFAAPVSVSSVSILGRNNSFEARDQYNVQFIGPDLNVIATRYIDDRHSPFVGTASAVPEPATWGMMILGLGGAGALLRRRQRVTANA